MGNSFFAEKPELLEIVKGNKKNQDQDLMQCNVLYYVYEDSIQVLLDEQIVRVFEGQALLIHGKTPYRQLCLDHTGYYRMMISDILSYQELWNDNNLYEEDQIYKIFELSQEQEICQNICEKMVDESTLEDPSKEVLDSFLEGILSLIWKIFLTDCDGQTGFVASAKIFIDKHYKENITLSEIAEYVNVSVYHLSHTFKDEMEISPIQYAIQCRMDYSKKQLVESNWSIHKIALELGYDNPNYFNLLFKKTVGMSPGKYRKLFRRERRK